MSFTQVGHCTKCGSPIWSPNVWDSILPPPSTYSCLCFSQQQQLPQTTTHFQQAEAAISKMLKNSPLQKTVEGTEALKSLGDALGKHLPPNDPVMSPVEKELASLKSDVRRVENLLTRVLETFTKALENEVEKKDNHNDEKARSTTKKRELLKG